VSGCQPPTANYCGPNGAATAAEQRLRTVALPGCLPLGDISSSKLRQLQHLFCVIFESAF
jgi:hypothetical protein